VEISSRNGIEVSSLLAVTWSSSDDKRPQASELVHQNLSGSSHISFDRFVTGLDSGCFVYPFIGFCFSNDQVRHEVEAQGG
jgi:hypothetical protein